MPDTEKDWKLDWVENLKRLGCLIAVLCFAAVAAGFFAPLQSRNARAEKLWQKGNAAFEAKDYETAAKHYKKAAEQGDTMAQNMLALCYETGAGVEQDYVQAAEWYRKAADQGLASAQLNLGSCYLYGAGVKKDEKQAVKLFRMSANQSNATAQLVLGNCYYNGWGVKKDTAEAVTWYRKAAEQGNDLAIEALKRLGVK